MTIYVLLSCFLINGQPPPLCDVVSKRTYETEAECERDKADIERYLAPNPNGKFELYCQQRTAPTTPPQ